MIDFKYARVAGLGIWAVGMYVLATPVMEFKRFFLGCNTMSLFEIFGVGAVGVFVVITGVILLIFDYNSFFNRQTTIDDYNDY